jgi:type IV pilus assembly protein PilM
MAMNAVRVGIDIEQASMVGAQVRTGRQGHTLTAASARALPDGLMFEGEVVDVEGLAAELKAFWKAAGFTGKRCFIGIANQKIVVRTMDFPLIDPKELRAAIEFQAQEAIPIPLDEAVLDFQVLSTTPGEGDAAGHQQVLIVAAQRDMIGQFMQVAKKAGLTVEGIDLQAFALMRSVAPPVAFVDQGAPQAEGASALINIGAGITNLVVASGGTPQFTRVVNLGYEALVQALAENRGVTRQEADVLRLTVGLTGGAAAATTDLEAATVDEIHEVLDSTCEAFADEIRRSIDYYHTLQQDAPIARILLSGEGSLTRNMCDYLAAALHLPVALANPLQYIAENKSKLPQAELELIAPRLAIALGLAFEDEE